MSLTQDIEQKKLLLELEAYSKDSSSNLLPLLFGVCKKLDDPDHIEAIHRKLQFYLYDMISQTENRSEAERLELLLDYFFVKKSFLLIDSKKTHYEEFDARISTVVMQKKGLPLSLVIVFLHFALHLDIPLLLINIPGQCILKWIRSGKTYFIDFLNQGHYLSESDLLQIINKHLKPNTPSPLCERLDNKTLLQQYLSQLHKVYCYSQDHKKNLLILDCLLCMAPYNGQYLSERALLKRKLGYYKEALADFKRYFSFMNQEQAPEHIKLAYYELKSFTEARSSHYEILH